MSIEQVHACIDRVFEFTAYYGERVALASIAVLAAGAAWLAWQWAAMGGAQ